MNVSLSEAANILSISNDDLMFLVQQKKIQAKVNQDTLAWVFSLTDILGYKNSK